MSDSPAAPADTSAPASDPAAAASAADVAPVGDAAAPAGGEATQSSEAGEGGASSEAGQGAGNDTVPQGDASADGEASTEGEGGDALGAPEQYADFTMPDGFTMPDAIRDGLTTFAKAQNLDQAKAQALVDLGVQQATAITEQFTAQALASPVLLPEHWAGVWSKQTAEDPDLGGSEAKLKTTMALATRVFATFSNEGFTKFLNETGLAHHPEMTRFMVNVGKAVREDTLVTPSGGTELGARPADRDQRTASKLYPNMN